MIQIKSKFEDVTNKFKEFKTETEKIIDQKLKLTN